MKNKIIIFAWVLFITLSLLPMFMKTKYNSEMVDGLNLTEDELSYIDELREIGHLDVAMRRFATVYKNEDGVISGLHYNLIKDFTDSLGIKLNVKIVDIKDYWLKDDINIDEARRNPELIYTPELFDSVDIYCDTLTVLPWREKLVRFIPIYPMREFIINNKNINVKDIRDLDGKRIAIQNESSNRDAFIRFEEELGIDFIYSFTETVKEILPILDKNKADATIYDSNRAFVEVSNYKNLIISIPVSDAHNLAWAVRKDNELLGNIMDKYLKYQKDTGKFDEYWSNDYTISFTEYLRLIED